MKHGTTVFLIAAVAILAAYAGWRTQQHAEETAAAPAGDHRAAVANLMALRLPDADGKLQPVSQWKGKTLVVNFWATWCPPCREEMPLLDAAGKTWSSRGVQVLGIGIDEAQAIAEFGKRNAIGFPLLVGSPDQIMISDALGNTSQALPFTVVIDAQGRLRHTKLGAFKGDQLDRLLGGLAAPAK